MKHKMKFNHTLSPFLFTLCAIFFILSICTHLSFMPFPFAQDENLTPKHKEALYWEKLGKDRVQCKLCPRRCILTHGEKGFCRARKNIGGILCSISYGRPVAVHIDPIEKKPFAHVYPGTKSFSLATAGCNLRCKFCQNWEISQADPEAVTVQFVTPEEVVTLAKRNKCKTIAFTYTEPTIFYEYMLDIAKEAQRETIECVMHSCGFINEKPLRQLAPYLTAANIDLKGFSEKYYSSFCEGNLETVLNTLKILKEKNVWIEVTTLIVPGGNDSEEELIKLCQWVKENLGENTPIHFSRFFPMYKLTNLPPTPVSTLIRARDIALKTGLKFIYVGNVPQHFGEDTTCSACKRLLIKRIGYTILENKIKDGKCPFCGTSIPGVWK